MELNYCYAKRPAKCVAAAQTGERDSFSQIVVRIKSLPRGTGRQRRLFASIPSTLPPISLDDSGSRALLGPQPLAEKFMGEDRPLVETALELAEVGLDQFLSCDLAKEIPVVGTAIQICTAADNIRNRLYASKLHAFIRVSDEIPEEKKEEFKKRLTHRQRRSTG